MKQKRIYVSPETKVVELKSTPVLLAGSDPYEIQKMSKQSLWEEEDE